MKKLTVVFLSYYAFFGILVNFIPKSLNNPQVSSYATTLLGLLFILWTVLGSYKLIKIIVNKLYEKQLNQAQ